MAKKFIDLKGLGRITANLKAYIHSLLRGKADVDLGNVSSEVFRKAQDEASIITTEGTGEAYTATVPGIAELKPGIRFTMIPHITSTTRTPTLDVNGLGAKGIRQPLTQSTGTTTTAAIDTWLHANFPVEVTYNGTLWVVDIPRPSAVALYGAVPVASGGTGASTAAEALENLGAAPAKHSHEAEDLPDHNHSAEDINTGTLGVNRLPTVPVSKGGTSATTAAAARANLGAAPAYSYGTEDLTEGVSELEPGTLYFVYEVS